MNKKMKPYLFIISSFLMTGNLTAEPQVDIDPITAGIAKLQQTGTPEALKPAFDSLKVKVAKLSAQKKLEAYLDFMNQIMTIYDPQFDTNPPPIFMNLSPGLGYDSGIDPKNIADRETRKAYELALAENAKNTKAASIQIAARNALDVLASQYSATLKAPDLSDQDRVDAVKKIKTSPLPNKLKAQVPQPPTRKIIPPTGGGGAPK